MPSPDPCVVILATGGTIAGRAARAEDNLGYSAAQLSGAELVAAVPALQDVPLEVHQVAQLDSKDMDEATWRALARACHQHLARPEVQAIVITHGTDTLEETGYFLHRVLPASKPVVLTAAMRPATALAPDGPQNLLDAVTTARWPGAAGVLAVLAGRVHAAADVRKLHGYRVEAFSSGEAGAVALVEEGQLRTLRNWPVSALHKHALQALSSPRWPWVELLTSHADADPRAIEALVAAGVQGLVIAGTGNGTVHQRWLAAAQRAHQHGVRVVRSSRCLLGGVVGSDASGLPSYGALTPPQARIELLLDLMASSR